MVTRPSSAPQRPRTASRQRAIFSEVLLVEVKPGTQKLAGPSQGRDIRSTRESRPLSANGFAARTRHVPALMLSNASKYAIIEPKVMESHRSVAGRCPRRLRIERLKKKYESQDIQRLLTERGVDVTLPWYEDKSPLPIEAFDNKDLDLRTPLEWLALGTNPDTGRYEKPLPVLALWRDPENGVGHWRRAVVMQYDSRVEKFEIQYEDWDAEPTDAGGRRGMMEFLPRLRVMFRGEDPEVFANRVEEAYKSRAAADCLLRYNFYIDNMPTDDVQQLNCDQMDWLRKAVSGLSEVTVDVAHEGVAPEVKTGRPGSTVDTADLELILQEVQLDFARAMRLGMVVAGTFASIMHKQSLQPSPRQPLWPRNRVTFDTHILQGSADPWYTLLLPYVEKGFVAQAVQGKPPAPWKGRISIPRHRFAETFAKLCFTLRVRPEVVFALQGIKAQSEQGLNENIFGIDESRPLRLDEFRQNLRSSCAEAALALKEEYPAALQSIVLREFDNVEKGWFNVREKNVDLYRHGKLRRFLLLARLIMQDFLRNLAKHSVSRYVTTIERLAPLEIIADSFASVRSTFRTSLQTPLLAVEMRPVESHDGVRLDFLTDPQRFVPTALDAYNAGLQILNEVYPLERLMIPPRLQSSDGPSLIEAFQSDEDWVEDGYRRIHAAMEAGCAGPAKYLATLQSWEPLLNRNPNSFVDHFFRDRTGEPEPSDQEIQSAISEEMRLRRELWKLPETIDVGMFEVTTKDFQPLLDVRKALAAKHEITHLLLMERLVRRLRTQMDDTICDVRSLLSMITKTPKTVLELVEMRKSLSAEFVRELLSEQDELQERLKEIEDTLKLFRTQPAYWDISSLSMARDAVESLWERIELAQEDAQKINKKEVVLERKTTDYSQIHHFSMTLNPFYQVWAIVYGFHEDEAKWQLGAIEDKDALRRKLLQTCQVLEKTVKSLQMGNWPAPIVQLGEQQLLKMEEFQILLLSVDHPHHEPDESDHDRTE
ncbi:unnamed protein product [Durusdinium trenchii]|uniref:Uncharacterized protein n=1 Tax=Durusdinium trenchii TaxID=1381693 RepID=A0ABP0IEX0_9DINO